jgi:hypothetical protein
VEQGVAGAHRYQGDGRDSGIAGHVLTSQDVDEVNDATIPGEEDDELLDSIIGSRKNDMACEL